MDQCVSVSEQCVILASAKAAAGNEVSIFVWLSCQLYIHRAGLDCSFTLPLLYCLVQELNSLVQKWLESLLHPAEEQEKYDILFNARLAHFFYVAVLSLLLSCLAVLAPWHISLGKYGWMY